jgi:hypothetical protein
MACQEQTLYLIVVDEKDEKKVLQDLTPRSTRFNNTTA